MKEGTQWYRIAELEKLSGVSRRTIHFYLQQNLLHPPTKTGQTMSYYDETHLRKLSFIKKEKTQGLPLIAIRHKIEEIEKQQTDAFGQKIPKTLKTGTKISLRPLISVPPKTRKEKSNKTRNSILEAGCLFFKEYGYKDTKISDITKQLDIGKGTFYFYFSNKQELLLECVPRIFNGLFQTNWNLIRQAKDPQKRLEQRAYAVIPVLKEFCAIIQLSKEAMEDSDPNIRQLGEETYLSIRKPLEVDIERGIRQGIFQPIDTKIASTMMIGLMENLYYIQTIDNSKTISDIWSHIFNLMMNGMKRHPQS